MKLAQLTTLHETEEGQKEMIRIAGMLEQGQVEWIEDLLSSLQEIISSSSKTTYSSNTKLGAIKLLKLCLEAGSEYFNKRIQQGTFLDELMKYAIVDSKTSYEDPTKEQRTSATMFLYILEGFKFWANWFPGTKFENLFRILMNKGVVFPEISDVTTFIFETSKVEALKTSL